MNLMEGYAKQQSVVVRQQCCDTPLFVEGDREQLHQVFVNLILNAVEAMPDGGELTIATQLSGGATPVARVSFCDNGSGIPDAIMQRIFEPFVSGKERGTGLGLAISRRIVEQHGARLTASNRQPHGAVFVVELPISGNRPVAASTNGHTESARDCKLGHDAATQQC
jgi:two-component system, NtrC family, sensor histidine kinase HydH